METKHTPGPWITEKQGSAIWIGPNRKGGKVDRIVTHVIIDVQHADSVKSERAANAKLISAAPELLQSCISLLEELGVKPDSDPEGFSRIVENALNAIKKATS
jgi:hypothetical protein